MQLCKNIHTPQYHQYHNLTYSYDIQGFWCRLHRYRLQHDEAHPIHAQWHNTLLPKWNLPQTHIHTPLCLEWWAPSLIIDPVSVNVIETTDSGRKIIIHSVPWLPHIKALRVNREIWGSSAYVGQTFEMLISSAYQAGHLELCVCECMHAVCVCVCVCHQDREWLFRPIPSIRSSLNCRVLWVPPAKLTAHRSTTAPYWILQVVQLQKDPYLHLEDGGLMLMLSEP